MMLLIDAGNTRVKWACVALASVCVPVASGSAGSGHAVAAGLGQWLHAGSMSHAEFAECADTGGFPWRGLGVQQVLASNVAGTALRDKLQAALDADGLNVRWFAAEPHLAGVTNRYRHPAQLGSDRFASAIAVHALFPARDVIVVTCGTATTIDAVSADGVFVGGMIAPGLKLMVESLHKNTAQLPAVAQSGNWLAGFADHTEAAIVSGCLSAQAGAIEHAVAAFARSGAVQSGMPLCVISGGAAGYIAPNLQIVHQRVDNVVLIGLQVVAQW